MAAFFRLFGSLAFFGFLALAPVGASADLAGGIAAFEQRDYAQALKELGPLAERGDAKAQLYLGRMYQEGLGVPLLESRAWSWIRAAANRGDVEAQFRVGLMHEQGFGVPKSNKEALNWYRKAGKAGHSGAKFRAGYMCYQGLGTKVNVHEALRWLSEAADAGEPDAEELLERIAAKGIKSPLLSRTPEGDEDEAAREIRAVVERILPTLGWSPGVGPALQLGGPIGVRKTGDSLYSVRLPKVGFVLGEGAALRLGSLQLDMEAKGEGVYRVAMRMPRRARLLDSAGKAIGELEMMEPKFEGVWADNLRAMTAYDSSFKSIRLTAKDSGGGLTLGIDNLKASLASQMPSAGKLDMAEKIEFQRIMIRSESGAGVFTVGGATANNDVAGLDIEGFARLMARIAGTSGQAATAELARAVRDLKNSPAIASGAKVSLGLRDIRFKDERGEGGAGRFDFGVAVTGLDQPSARISLSLGLDDATGSSRDAPNMSFPKRIQIAVGVENLPSRELIALLADMAIGAMSPHSRPGGDSSADMIESLSRAIEKAGVTVAVDEILVAGEAYDVNVRGVFRPSPVSPAGIVGETRIMVRGLDALLSGAGDTDMTKGLAAALAGFRDMALPGKDDKDRDVEIFDLRFRPDGGIDVNGQELMGAVKPGERAPERKRDKKAPTPLRKS